MLNLSKLRFTSGPFSRFYSVHKKYAAQLTAKAEALGLTVDDLLKQVQPKVELQKKRDVSDLVEQAQKFKLQKPAESSRELGSKQSTLSKIEQIKQKKPSAATMELDSFIDVSKFEPHSSKEVEMLWKARFLNSPLGFGGSMTSMAFSKMYVNIRKYPTFVLPLPHKAHGIELHYVQWSLVTSETVYCLLTSLAQYKLYNEYAQPHTTFMLHTNFAADKDIVLTNGIMQENGVSMENAALLTLNLQRFYTASPDSPSVSEKLDLLKRFNTGDPSFSVDSLIAATETLD